MTGRSDRFFRRAGVAAAALGVAAFVVLTFGGVMRSVALVLLAAVLLALAAVGLQVALSHIPRTPRLRAVRLWVPVAIAAAGGLLMLWWWQGTRLGHPTGGVGLCGFCLFYLGTGQALAELRSRRGGAPQPSCAWTPRRCRWGRPR
jgi:hypothetical protein